MHRIVNCSLHLSPPKMLEPQVELIAPKNAAALDRAALAAPEASVVLFLLGFFYKEEMDGIL